MEPAPPAGGAATPAPGADPPKPTEGAPSYVTEEQLQAALTARFRTFEQKVDKTLSEGLGTFGTKLKDELAALFPKAEPKPEPAAPKDGKPREEPNPELRRLQEQIGVLTQQADDARAERDAERARTRDSVLRQRVTDALSGVGIEGVRARHAIGVLVDAEKRVRWGEDGASILFRTDSHDELELAAGVREWLKTEDAKLYLPARGALGSGDRPGALPPPRAPAGPPDRTTVADGLRRVLLGQI